MIYPNLFICKSTAGTVAFRAGNNAAEVLEYSPDIVEAYQLTEAQAAEVSAAWSQYIKHQSTNEPRARELLAAVMRSLFKRAKEANNKEENSQ